MEIHKDFYRKFSLNKIQINQNKNPIRMDLFLSFLTIETEISRDHLGSSNGWTQRFNTERNLIIGGGVVHGVNYLDSLQYGNKLHNPYNNYVTPFQLFDIFTDEGKLFFIDYFKDEINKIIVSNKSDIENLKIELKEAKGFRTELLNEIKRITPQTK